MLSILKAFGRVLWMHWPPLLAWMLVGVLGGYIAIQFAGFVGAYSAPLGMLLLPLGVLIRLVSAVAMFLVLRGGLRNLQAIAPVPESPRERRRTFLEALLISILPYFAVYAAGGMLRDDVAAYSVRALQVRQGIIFSSPIDDNALDGDVVTQVSFNVVTVSIIVVAFMVRWLLKRHAKQLPKWVALLAVYLEATWVFFTAFFISDAIGSFTGWIDNRVAMHWLADARQWMSDQLVPIAWIWDFIEWVLGALGGVLLEPLAWLAIAGVIYGQAIKPSRLRVRIAALDKAKGRYAKVPEVVRERLDDVADGFVDRFRPIGRSLLLMWRSGPLLIAGFAFAYAVLKFVEHSLEAWVITLIGPQDLYTFWMVADALIFALVSLLFEPVRIAVIAVFYDATLGELRRAIEASGAEDEAEVTDNAEDGQAVIPDRS